MLAGGVAFAAIPAADGVIHGCYNTSTGTLRVVESDDQCRSNEKPLPWNQSGQQGPQGIPGPTGPAGPAGPGNEIWFEQRPDDVTIPGSPPGPVTWQVIADVDVPAGTYLLTGATTIDFGGTNLPDTEGRCEVRVGADQLVKESLFRVPGGMTTPMSITGVTTVTDTTPVQMRCFSFDAIGVLNTTLTATKVTAAHT